MDHHLFSRALLFFALSGVALAQADAQAEEPNLPIAARAESVSKDRAEGLIKLDVLVTDGEGRLVPGLPKSDFSLLENGQPQKIVTFEAANPAESGEAEPPASIRSGKIG